jgi:glycosyltransferase involved in cell wall biosynthesis
VVSEKDNGLYDALNKGIRLASGEVTGILHSDDFYTSNNVLQSYARVFLKEEPDAVYSDLYYVHKTNTDKIIRKWKSGIYRKGSFLYGWMPPHPTLLVRSKIYQQYGGFNLQLKSAADYELMLRFIHKHEIRLAYLPQFTIKMRVGGKSNETLNNRIRANREDRLAWKINGLRPGFYTLYLKPLRKIFQFFSR